MYMQTLFGVKTERTIRSGASLFASPPLD